MFGNPLGVADTRSRNDDPAVLSYSKLKKTLKIYLFLI